MNKERYFVWKNYEALEELVESGPSTATIVEKSITANGTYNATSDDADGYNPVIVNVANSYSASDEGKVVDNGALVSQTSTSINVNGTYDTTLNNSVIVNVQPLAEKDVNFYDYDGTPVASYTAQEFLALTAMPENPTHEGLTAQGWNWSLSDAKTYVTTYTKLNIGQMYVTSDGKTRLYIELTEGRLTPYLKLYLNDNSELDIDWGDNSTHSTFTSTSADYVSEMHTYASAGSYIIAITVINGGFVLQSPSSPSSSLSTLLTNNNNSVSSPDIGYLNSVKKIEIGSGIATIGDYAFRLCYSLKSITIPDSVTSIGNQAFYSCYSLTSITIPSSVTSISDSTFYRCYSLTSITIPSSVTTIGDGAFNSCRSLTSITIPSSVTTIGTNGFGGCISLTSITIPSGVTTIDGSTFTDCNALSSITIPNSVTSIEQSAFSSCNSLTSITIPSGVTTIGTKAFYSCSSLTSITIPSSVTSIGNQTFSNCSSLATITINKAENSISGSPWSAKTTSPTFTQIVWTG